MPSKVRLNKFLASTGLASRRGSENLIREGRVKIDGVVVRELGVQVDPARSIIEVDDERVRQTPNMWIALNKLPRTICTRTDPQGRPTVYESLHADHRQLFHVGRLDVMSEGLLLFTNDGDVAQAMLHPSRRVPRRYEVTTRGPLPPKLADTLESGVKLEDGKARAERVRIRKGPRQGQHVIELVLREGRNREVRRLMRALDVHVDALKRVGFGPIELGRLKPGTWRRLGAGELRSLRRLTKNKR